MFVFHHITRTGGGTLNYILNRHYGKYLLMIHGNEISKVLGYERNHPSGGSDALTKSLTDNELEQILDQHEDIHCISSHAFTFPNRFTDFNVMVILRNPVEQILSLYFTLCDRYSRGRPLPDYANHDFRENIQMFIKYSKDISNKYGIKNYCTNFQTHVIDNSLDVNAAISRLKNEFWFVGVTERFDESLLILKNQFKIIGKNLNIMYFKRNVNSFSHKNLYLKNQVFDNQRDHETLIRLNALDLKVYEEANNILDEKIKNYEGNFNADLIKFKMELLLWKKYKSMIPNKFQNIVNRLRR